MENFLYPTDARDYLKKLRGRSIVRVRRQLLRSDYVELPVETRDQESDGPTELEFDDATKIRFESDTEGMSIKVAPGPMEIRREQYVLVDVSKNEFWVAKIGKRVVAIDTLISKYSSLDCRGEFAVAIALEGDLHFCIEYLSDDQHTDLIRITDDLPAGDYDRVSVG